ncbi:MAG: hypothetical protein EA346_05720 [Thioalkalivibrio sp.]|nr:MAG: hypothetical protein EA346_05720 [Thioalkalivibrio sp.]
MNPVVFGIDSPAGGAAERSVATSATEMGASGTDVCILTLGDGFACALDPGIRYVRLIMKKVGMPGKRTLPNRAETAAARERDRGQ